MTFRGARPDTITCLGGESLDGHNLEHLSEVTGLRCCVGLPLRDLTVTSALPDEENQGPMAEWTTAAGLSMKPVATRVEVPAR